ncbi:MAG: hypothetical protein EBU08_14585 [Micrococcales bacterium]|nr:hypothetical protein [Micrococcales bacterium]
MARTRGNRGLIGSQQLVTASSASGIHSIIDHLLNKGAGTWPISGGYTIIQTFTGNSTWTCPAGVTSVEYLVVAGGGGGGANGGGGGAGGFRTGSGLTVTPTQNYTITVGGGGLGGTAENGATASSGGDSYISGSPISNNPSSGNPYTNALVAYGGGGAGNRSGGSGGNGGSGGGSASGSGSLVNGGTGNDILYGGAGNDINHRASS